MRPDGINQELWIRRKEFSREEHLFIEETSRYANPFGRKDLKNTYEPLEHSQFIRRVVLQFEC